MLTLFDETSHELSRWMSVGSRAGGQFWGAAVTSKVVRKNV